MSGLNLKKGGKLNLSKVTKSSLFGCPLTWNKNPYKGAEFDLDVWAILLETVEDPKNPGTKIDRAVGGMRGVTYYNELVSACGGVTHTGDERTGGKEEIHLDFSKIDKRATKVAIICSIDGAPENGQNFGMMEGAEIKVLDRENGDKVLCSYELDEDFDTEQAINAGEFYLRNGNWSFKAVGAGFDDGMVAFLDKYGVEAHY